ncbi:hypothetical protein G9C98_002821 [Cotesia typhae]|uniref:Transcription initiation factor TFIID subunit 6 n=1 Tax=Cotesia typhae TaxID=2053667 RepID=A0A8J5R904_9HYME|nr:hypothetical protein G9C98_002821 [Cotesia typhae]
MSTESDSVYGTTLSQESMKVIAESIGVGNLPDEAAKDLAEDIKNIEPTYGFFAKEHIPFRFASGGGRELHFVEDKELDLQEMISMAKSQKLESVDPTAKLVAKTTNVGVGKPGGGGKSQKLRNVETVHVKQLATHELSVEQQLYYKEITEACVGSDEARRAEALQSLSADPGLHEMLARMCTFIAEGVRVNVVQNNLALLIYLMRMVKALLDNPSLYLEKYLHELIPSVATCIVSKQLCMRPEADNHWALRDFASRLMGQICRNFNTSTNNVQTRVTRMFSHALTKNSQTPLASLYGAISGLCELGPEVIKALVIPKIKSISDRIENSAEGLTSNIDKNAAGHIKTKTVAPVLKTIRSPPDFVEEYKLDYGYMGPMLCSAVAKAQHISVANPSPSQQRTIVVGPGRNPTVTSTPGGQKYVILQSRSQTPTSTNIQQQQHQQQQAQQSQPGQQQSSQQIKVMSTSIQQKSQIQPNSSKLVVVCMANTSHVTTPTVSQVSSVSTNPPNVLITQTSTDQQLSPFDDHSLM